MSTDPKNMAPDLGVIKDVLAAAPMTKWLDASVEDDNGAPIYRLTFAERHIGNPVIRALHGGVIAALMETAARADLAGRLGDANAQLTVINIAIDYLASSRAKDMTASVKPLRIGRRIAFMEATGWQGDKDRPVATARICLRRC